MTLARTALRLAAREALVGAQDRRPTIAGNRVYDSRIGAIDPKSWADAKPLIIIHTDGDEGDPSDMKDGVSPAGGPPFWRSMDLVIECAMVAYGDDGGGAFVLGYAVTDKQLEAQLDFLEHQVWQVLARGSSPAARVFRRIAKLMRYQSHRQASDEHGDRVAVRLLTFRCRVHDHCPIPEPGATGLDRLPKPLSDVAKILDPASEAGKVVATIAEAMASPDPLPVLAGIAFGFDFGNPADGAPDVAGALLLPTG